MKSPFLAVAAVTLAAWGVVTLALAAERDAGRGYELENVQVMDPTTRLADARRYMVTFNEALGVQCRDCHVLRDFKSDEKPLKLMAREMMKMQVQINGSWFPEEGERITCWTCHRGQRVPPYTAVLSDEAADSALQDLDKEDASSKGIESK